MENNLQLFKNPMFGEIRVAGTSEAPFFCLSDLCEILGLSVKGVNQRLDKEVISNYPLPTPGGVQQMNFVNEDGLYDVILDSRKPQAKLFRKWITSEVLPTIRKTGGYIASTPGDTDEDILARALIVAHEKIQSKQQRIQMLEGENEKLAEENRSLAPRAQYTDEVLQSPSTYTFVQMAKELGFKSVNALTQRLVSDRIVFKQSDTYLLYSKHSGKGYTATRTCRFFHKDGTVGTSARTVWTELGRKFLHEHFKVDFAPVDFSGIEFPVT